MAVMEEFVPSQAMSPSFSSWVKSRKTMSTVSACAALFQFCSPSGSKEETSHATAGEIFGWPRTGSGGRSSWAFTRQLRMKMRLTEVTEESLEEFVDLDSHCKISISNICCKVVTHAFCSWLHLCPSKNGAMTQVQVKLRLPQLPGSGNAECDNTELMGNIIKKGGGTKEASGC